MKLNKKYYLIRVHHVMFHGYVKLLFSFKNDEPIVHYENFESLINNITKFRSKIFANWICKMLNKSNYFVNYEVVCFIKTIDPTTKEIIYNKLDNKITFTDVYETNNKK